MFNKKNALKLELNYRGFTLIKGSDYMIAPLCSQEKAFKGTFQYTTHNYLFLNIQDFSTHWLFQTNDQILNVLYQIPIEFSQTIKENYYHEKFQPFNDSEHDIFDEKIIQTGWLLFVFTKSQNTQTIALSDPSVSNFTEIIDEVDSICDKVRASKDELILLYNSKQQYLVSKIKLSEKKVIQTKELPKIQ